MRILICDGETGDYRRPWADIVPGCKPLTIGVDGDFDSAPRDKEVLVIHRYSETDIRGALGDAEVAAIIISGSPRSPCAASDKRFYHRRAAVCDRDHMFASMLQRFLDHFVKTGERRWELLEPRCPEHVLACYLSVLGSIEPLPEWQQGFENEVDYFRKGEGLETDLSWRNKMDLGKLREFLMAAQCLREAPSIHLS